MCGVILQIVSYRKQVTYLPGFVKSATTCHTNNAAAKGIEEYFGRLTKGEKYGSYRRTGRDRRMIPCN